MKSLKIIILILNLFFAANLLTAQEVFTRMDSIPNDKCVVYVCREASLNGAAAEFKVRVWELYSDYFNYKEGESFYIPYAKLKTKEYAPIVLDSDKLYRVYVSNVGNMVTSKN